MENYLKIREDFVVPFLKELWHLRVPGFSAVLSFIFFAFIPQTLEVYRVFALNSSKFPLRIFFSYTFIFLLSLSIWYAGRALSIKRKEEKEEVIKERKKSLKENKQRAFQEKEEANKEAVIKKRKTIIRELKTWKCTWRWTPRIFGLFPLLGLGVGLITTINKTTNVGWLISFLHFIFIVLSLLPVWSNTLTKTTGEKFRSQLAIILPLPVIGFISVLGIQKIKECWNESPVADENTQCGTFFLLLGIAFTALLANIFLFFVKNRNPNKLNPSDGDGRLENEDPTNSYFGRAVNFSKQTFNSAKQLPNDENLFGGDFLLSLQFLSVLTFTVFTLPLISSDWIKYLAIISILIFLYLFWLFSKNSNWVLMIFLLVVFAVILLSIAFVVPPLASHVGSVTIISVFLIIFTLWSTAIFYQGHKLKIPLIAMMLVFAILLSLFNGSDNHRLREISSSERADLNESASANEVSTLDDGFVKFDKLLVDKWLDERKDEIEAFNDADKSYPIYIVSAQGGGIFAAYHSALTLSGIQDLCPTFASHIFAISGVSGGSLGATVFSSLVKAETEDNAGKPYFKQEKTCKPSFSHIDEGSNLGPLATKANALLDDDLLSPLLAAGLFPDFIQRFLPSFSNLSESIDRARGMEYAFERAWKEPGENKENPRNPLGKSFYAHWDPANAAPALVLNTTVVETGDRLVISPFKVDLPNLKDIRTVAYKENIDLPLSTAALLSARFPIVTPVAWFDRCVALGEDKKCSKKQKARLADGGYFENSGVSTAVDLGSKLEEILKAKKWLEPTCETSAIQKPKIKVIYLAVTSQPSKNIPKAGGFNEIMSPVGALWNSREARGLDVINRVEYLKDAANNVSIVCGPDDSIAKPSDAKPSELSKFKSKYADHHFRQFFLYDGNPGSTVQTNTFELPLGWLLSDFSKRFIQEKIGYRSDGEISRDYKKGCQEDNWKLASNNLCVIRSISEELTH